MSYIRNCRRLTRKEDLRFILRRFSNWNLQLFIHMENTWKTCPFCFNFRFPFHHVARGTGTNLRTAATGPFAPRSGSLDLLWGFVADGFAWPRPVHRALRWQRVLQSRLLNVTSCGIALYCACCFWMFLDVFGPPVGLSIPACFGISLKSEDSYGGCWFNIRVTACGWCFGRLRFQKERSSMLKCCEGFNEMERQHATAKPLSNNFWARGNIDDAAICQFWSILPILL